MLSVLQLGDAAHLLRILLFKVVDCLLQVDLIDFPLLKRVLHVFVLLDLALEFQFVVLNLLVQIGDLLLLSDILVLEVKDVLLLSIVGLLDAFKLLVLDGFAQLCL